MKRSVVLMLLAAFTFTLSMPAQAQLFKKKKDTESSDKKKKDEKSYEGIIEKSEKFEGLFTIYRDTTKGNTYLEIPADFLGEEFIYFSHVSDGVLDAGFFRGAYRGSKIVRFEKHYDHIEVMQENTSYYYDEDNALFKAKDANINTPLILSQEIVATSEDGKNHLIDGDAVFKSEDFQMVKPASKKGAPPSMLGKLSKEKTKIEKVNNYPENTDVRVAYVYENDNPQKRGSSAVTDARYITIVYQHSLLRVPKNNYQPRKDDGRIGYFMTQVNDMTSFSATPYKDMIHRWHLEKKDPTLALSEPVEPIVWWIENTTPDEFRPIIKAGVERWNESFEKAGFKNAVVVKIQPDSADWDAGDIRYNVLRWTSSPNPPFGGYGPSFVNPRTGQILGADIMLEFASVTNRLHREKVFSIAGLPMEEDFHSSHDEFDPHFCAAGLLIKHNTVFGTTAMNAMNMTEATKKDFVKETLYRLALHEVGHTLGLTHNMRASTMQSIQDIKNKDVVDSEGLANSVMEYPAINFPASEMERTLFYDVKPGPYDHWVIEYGYSPALEDEEAEEERLEEILSRSSQPELAYGNDADDMRSPGRGIDPDINIYDLSDDPLNYAINRIELVNSVMPKIKESYIKEDQTYHELRTAYLSLTSEYAIQLGVITRQIGGVHLDRSLPGQESETRPFEPVSAEKQKAAMDALAKYAFAPDAFSVPGDLLNYLQPQRRGFSHFGNNPDPQVHERILGIQERCLDHLLHRTVLERISDSELYGNEYDLGEMMTDLTDAIFEADKRSSITPMRQNLQVEYVERLIDMLDEKKKYDNVSQGMALFELKRIRKEIDTPKPDVLTQAHRDYITTLIDKAFES